MDVFERVSTGLYRRLGERYWVVLAAGQMATSVFVAGLTVIVIATYYDPTLDDLAPVLGCGLGSTLVGVAIAQLRSRHLLERVLCRDGEEAPGDEVQDWQTASTLVLQTYRRSSLLVSAIAIVPTVTLTTALWGLGWDGFGAVLLACLVPAAYATVLSYSTGEVLMRPVVLRIAARLPEDFPFEATGLEAAKRLRLGLPVYTAFTGVLTAGLVGGGNGSGDLALAVVVSLAVGIALSHELTVLLSQAIFTPIEAVRRQLAQVRSGDLSGRVPVLSSDELGELTHDVNLMTAGLREREEIREAFSTYMDKAVAQLILSGQFPQDGVEVDVSILFCDVRGFTAYAERVDATEVIATLNRLFGTIVPIVDEHGGHVDKFTGDGLLAVFGAPEPYLDHADRAVAAGRAMVDAVAGGPTALRIAVGVNTGRVVAGPVGGAGRLNFSVIGDAVNVAARVEAATRETGDDMLLTGTTRAALLSDVPLLSRGSVPLKGKSESVEVYAVAAAGPDAPRGDASAASAAG